MKNDKTYTVFVVEDSDVYRSLVMRTLESDQTMHRKGYAIKFYEFSSGEECLEYMNNSKPDIMIIDYHLNSSGYEKNMNGLKLIKHIRTVSPDTAIIILSSQKNVEVVKELFQEGVKEYIKKDSVALHRVKETVKKLLGLGDSQPSHIVETT